MVAVEAAAASEGVFFTRELFAGEGAPEPRSAAEGVDPAVVVILIPPPTPPPTYRPEEKMSAEADEAEALGTVLAAAAKEPPCAPRRPVLGE